MAIPPPFPTKPKNNDRIVIGASIVLAIIVAGGLAVGGVMFSRRAQAKREALAGFQKSVSDERTKMADSIKSGKTGDADSAIGRVKDQLGQAASQLGGADGRAAQAMAGWLTTVQLQMRSYEASVARLKQESIFKFDIRNRADIEPHRQVVREFLASNARLMNTFQHGEDQVRAALEAAQVPTATLEATMAGYTRAQATQRPLQMQIRGCDKTLGESALEILDLLDRNWGKWQRDETTGHLRFQDTATLAAFNASLQKIQTAGAEQHKAQEQLVAQIKASPAP